MEAELQKITVGCRNSRMVIESIPYLRLETCDENTVMLPERIMDQDSTKNVECIVPSWISDMLFPIGAQHAAGSDASEALQVQWLQIMDKDVFSLAVYKAVGVEKIIFGRPVLSKLLCFERWSLKNMPDLKTLVVVSVKQNCQLFSWFWHYILWLKADVITV